MTSIIIKNAFFIHISTADQVTYLLYFVIAMVILYIIATCAVVHVSWNVTLGVLAHMFQAIKQQCKITFIKNTANQNQHTKVMCLRKMHQRCCELMRDYNDIYSFQILFEIARLFSMLLVNLYRIVMHLANLGVANFHIIDEASVILVAYTLFAIVVNAHNCILQVCTIKCSYGLSKNVGRAASLYKYSNT